MKDYLKNCKIVVVVKLSYCKIAARINIRMINVRKPSLTTGGKTDQRFIVETEPKKLKQILEGV